jgi:arylsulfatase A-like enzyme
MITVILTWDVMDMRIYIHPTWINWQVMVPCLPRRIPLHISASILSGRNVLDIRMMRFSTPLPKDLKTIPEYLREKGYYTGICGRHYHLDGSGYKAQETIETFEKYDMVTFPDRVHYLKQGSDDEVLGQFTTFLNELPDGKPFFMWMNYSDPHRRFTAPDYGPDPKKITVPPSMSDIPEVREDLAAHLGKINRLDENVGLVLDKIKDGGMENQDYYDDDSDFKKVFFNGAPNGKRAVFIANLEAFLT